MAAVEDPMVIIILPMRHAPMVGVVVTARPLTGEEEVATMVATN